MSEVSASLVIAVVNAALRLSLVAIEFAPILNSFGPGAADVVAVNVMSSLVPSGRLKL